MFNTFDQLYSWITSACADMADGNECEADNNFNDPQLLADLIGDAIYGSPNQDELLCELIDESGALGKAAEIIVDRMVLVSNSTMEDP